MRSPNKDHAGRDGVDCDVLDLLRQPNALYSAAERVRREERQARVAAEVHRPHTL